MSNINARRLIVFGIFVACLFRCGIADAVPITVPTDLNVGDKYRLAFVTSTTRRATSTNIADYNTFVTDVANTVTELAALGTTWKAIGSTATVNAKDNTGTDPTFGIDVPIYRLDGFRIAVTNADLWDGTIVLPLRHTEDGGLFFGSVWTGTTTEGLRGPFGNWLGDTNVRAGSSSVVDARWINDFLSSRFNFGPLYAMSGVLTVIPEPSSMILVCIGATAVVGWQLRRRRQRKRQ